MGPVEIGDLLSTGPFAAILGPRHALLGKTEGMTVIGKNVWLSTGSIIHFGVKIGDNAVIGPGSVVTKDVAGNAYVAGNPARNITELSNLREFMRTRGKDAT
jgi:maltose O-acetyltransferase